MHRILVSSLVVAAATLNGGCGDKIGDECQVSSDCSTAGDRICDTGSPGGYCTVAGCDFDTCPEDSVCIRFFGGVTNETNTCDPRSEDRTTDDCSPDDLCTLAGSCVPRVAETRFCMQTCGGADDCREGYECRNEELMRLHGGEPVTEPGEALGIDLQSFCAEEPLP